jgi:hypothetical protein
MDHFGIYLGAVSPWVLLALALLVLVAIGLLLKFIVVQ